MTRPSLNLLVVAFLGLCVLFSGSACGGGGGSNGGSTNTDSGGTTTSTALVVSVVGTSPADPAGAARSLANTVVGEAVSVSGLVVTRTSGAAPVSSLAKLSNLRTTAPSSVATLNSSTGLLTAVGNSDTSYSVTGTYNGKSYSATLTVSAAGSRLATNGLVRLGNGTAVAGATIRFYTSTGTLVSQVVSGSTGYYQANLPSTVGELTVDVTALNAGGTLYYTAYAYGDANYDTTFGGCPVSLSNFAGGGLNDAVFTLVGSSIPPPPTGCGGSTS